MKTRFRMPSYLDHRQALTIGYSLGARSRVNNQSYPQRDLYPLDLGHLEIPPRKANRVHRSNEVQPRIRLSLNFPFDDCFRTLPCHGRGRGFEPRRPRHTFQKIYGTYGPNVTSESGFDMGAIRVLPPILREFFILHFTQIWNHHLHNLALCCPLVRVHRLCVDIQRDPAIRVP